MAVARLASEKLELSAVGSRGEAGDASEGASEVRGVDVTNGGSDLADGEFGLFQQAFPFSDAQSGEVLGERMTEVGGDELSQVAGVVSERLGGVVTRDALPEVLLAEFNGGLNCLPGSVRADGCGGFGGIHGHELSAPEAADDEAR